MPIQHQPFRRRRSRSVVFRCWSAPLLAPLIIAAVSCTPPSISASASAPSVGQSAGVAIVLAPPHQIGAFTLTDTRRFPDPNTGVRYRYTGTGALRPDVFVYPAAPSVEQPGIRDTLAYESEKFGQALTVMQQRGTYQSVRILSESESEIRTSAGPIMGRRVSVVLTQDGQQLDSHQVLFLIHGQFVKVRTTHVAGAAVSQELFDFLGGLISALMADRK